MTSFKKIFKLLKKKNLKISFAESCTGGLLSSGLTSISGSSKVFHLGLITYSNETKIDVLKVPKKIIKKYGAVSYQCCLSMVNKLSSLSKSNVNISITGIAGPQGGTKKKPIGLVFIGIKFRKKIIIKKFLFKKNTRKNIQKSAVNSALDMILNLLK